MTILSIQKREANFSNTIENYNTIENRMRALQGKVENAFFAFFIYCSGSSEKTDLNKSFFKITKNWLTIEIANIIKDCDELKAIFETDNLTNFICDRLSNGACVNGYEIVFFSTIQRLHLEEKLSDELDRQPSSVGLARKLDRLRSGRAGRLANGLADRLARGSARVITDGNGRVITELTDGYNRRLAKHDEVVVRGLCTRLIEYDGVDKAFQTHLLANKNKSNYLNKIFSIVDYAKIGASCGQEEKIMFPAVYQNSRHLFRYASKQLKDNKELVLVVLKRFPKAFRLVSKRLQDDKEVAIAAVTSVDQHGPLNNLQWASKRLQDDKEVVIAAVTGVNQRGHQYWLSNNLQWASKRLQDDKEVVTAALGKTL